MTTILAEKELAAKKTPAKKAKKATAKKASASKPVGKKAAPKKAVKKPAAAPTKPVEKEEGKKLSFQAILAMMGKAGDIGEALKRGNKEEAEKIVASLKADKKITVNHMVLVGGTLLHIANNQPLVKYKTKAEASNAILNFIVSPPLSTAETPAVIAPPASTAVEKDVAPPTPAAEAVAVPAKAGAKAPRMAAAILVDVAHSVGSFGIPMFRVLLVEPKGQSKLVLPTVPLGDAKNTSAAGIKSVGTKILKKFVSGIRTTQSDYNRNDRSMFSVKPAPAHPKGGQWLPFVLNFSTQQHKNGQFVPADPIKPNTAVCRDARWVSLSSILFGLSDYNVDVSTSFFLQHVFGKRDDIISPSQYEMVCRLASLIKSMKTIADAAGNIASQTPNEHKKEEFSTLEKAFDKAIAAATLLGIKELASRSQGAKACEDASTFIAHWAKMTTDINEKYPTLGLLPA